MKKQIFTLPVAAVFLLSCSTGISIDNMKVEFAENAMAVDTRSPRLTWSYDAPEGFYQHSYEIHIATDKKGLANPDVWNSGLILDEKSFARVDDCPVIESCSEYWWQVTASDENGRQVVSPAAKFETGMLDKSDWSASWISDGADRDDASAPMFRKDFNAGRNIVKARMYMSAAGYAELKINGKKVTDAFLEPGYTHYDKRNLYCVYDVTDKIKCGANVISSVLGNGFYNEIKPVATWKFENARWRNRARFLCEVHVTYADGSVQVIGTDESWKTTANGPYISNNIYSGDIYDARKEIDGWDKPGFDDSEYGCAVPVEAPSSELTAQIMPPIAPEAILKPVGFKSFGDTLYVYDFGKNIAGVSRLTASGEPGTKVTLEHGELVKDNGRVEMGNINIYFYPEENYEIQKDIYYMKGGKKETWNPIFCYHGFRYVEVKSDKPLQLDENSLEAIYFHTAAPSVGNFECSEEIFEGVWDIVRRTYCNNFHSIISDCPTREKNGWTADNHLSVELGLLNFDGITFYEKWVDDVIDNIREDGRISGIIPDDCWGYDDWIGPVWDAAMFIIPNTMYNFTGDLSNVEKLWPVWTKYLDYLKTREEEDGLVTYGIGDWVYYRIPTPTQYTTPVFYYFDYCTMARFAELTGRDAAPYKAKAEAIREAINAKWFNYEANLYANGTMAAQGVALYFGVVPEGREQAVADNLAQLVHDNNGYLEFGSMGSKTVLRMLTKYGHVQEAYTMATKEECPSWGWWLKQGFTTCGETWALDPNFRDASTDHVFLGDVAAWYVNCLAGINFDPDIPGFRHIIIEPHFPDGLEWVKAGYNSICGPISSEWHRTGEGAELAFSIPANATATLIVNGESTDYPSGNHTVKISEIFD